jgi:hypothetical protein
MAEHTADSPADPLSAIDPVIHAPARLRVVTQLYVVEAADAAFLVNRTGLTWGNLSTHLGKLEESGYVMLEKGYRGKKPRTNDPPHRGGPRGVPSVPRQHAAGAGRPAGVSYGGMRGRPLSISVRRQGPR